MSHNRCLRIRMSCVFFAAFRGWTLKEAVRIDVWHFTRIFCCIENPVMFEANSSHYKLKIVYVLDPLLRLLTLVYHTKLKYNSAVSEFTVQSPFCFLCPCLTVFFPQTSPGRSTSAAEIFLSREFFFW